MNVETIHNLACNTCHHVGLHDRGDWLWCPSCGWLTEQPADWDDAPATPAAAPGK